jgi:hypothetical protein
LKAGTIPATTILNPKPLLRQEFSCGRNLALSHFFKVSLQSAELSPIFGDGLAGQAAAVLG